MVQLLGQEWVVVALVHAGKRVVHFAVRGLVLADGQEQVAEGGVGACVCVSKCVCVRAYCRLERWSLCAFINLEKNKMLLLVFVPPTDDL
jgi:hypothetical protein